MSAATTEKPLRAYHGDEDLKEKTVAEARWHREQSLLVKDLYFEKGSKKACAVGCLTKNPSGGHSEYPDLFGIPTWMAYLEERVFVGLPEEKALLWPERFLSAIPVGADFDGLADRLAIRRLKEECLPLSGQWPESVRAQVVASIEQTIAALESGKEEELSAAWSAAESAAESAAWSAESAESAKSAAWSAKSAAESAESAESAAESAAWSAESAAESAESAESAAESAAWSAKSAAYEREANRLIAELENLPVREAVPA
jgi:hypothetical protein